MPPRTNYEIFEAAERDIGRAIRAAGRDAPSPAFQWLVPPRKSQRGVVKVSPGFPAWRGRAIEDVWRRRAGPKTRLCVGREMVYGEIAVLRVLERLGWSGVWVNTYGSMKGLWQRNPGQRGLVAPEELPTGARRLYEGILEARGGRSGGFWDVFAWKPRGRFVFAECKEPGTGDKLNENQQAWLPAAQRTCRTRGLDARFLLIEWWAAHG